MLLRSRHCAPETNTDRRTAARDICRTLPLKGKSSKVTDNEKREIKLTTTVMILARLRHGNLSTLTVTSFYVISTKRNGPTSICILGQMTCGKNGKNCFSVMLTNMHHSNLKRVHKSEVLALLVIYCVRPEEEIFLKTSQSLLSHVGVMIIMQTILGG